MRQTLAHSMHTTQMQLQAKKTKRHFKTEIKSSFNGACNWSGCKLSWTLEINSPEINTPPLPAGVLVN